MTTRTLTGTYGATYTLAAPVTKLSITSTGKLEAGVTAAASGTYTVVNQGVVDDYLYLKGSSVVTNSGTVGTAGNPSGVLLRAGGRVTNDASGQISTVSALGVATVSNLGTVSGGGVLLGRGGTVTNGSASDTEALIAGGNAGPDFGVEAEDVATFVNFGVVSASTGVEFIAGGAITNGSLADTTALIEGSIGVACLTSIAYALVGTVRNFGTIATTAIGVQVSESDLLVNGAATDLTAWIGGDVAVIESLATVLNFGTITAPAASSSSRFGVYADGGHVTNGSSADTVALIEGPTGIYGKTDPVTVTNFASIVGTAVGVALTAGGAVVNGSASDASAVIQGVVQGVIIAGTGANVTNFATILGSGAGGIGVVMDDGVVTNGSVSDTAALIDGQEVGLAVTGPGGAIHNFGAIGHPTALNGVNLLYGGRVTNGSSFDTIAAIEGYIGIAMPGLNGTVTPASGTVINFATIGDAEARIGVGLGYGGEVINGTASDSAARIEARAGGVVVQAHAGTVGNFGTIIGDEGPAYGSYLEPGVSLAGGGHVTNGSTANTIALIQGLVGVYAKTDPVTVTNFATIAGTGGDAVELTAGGRINAEADSVFAGVVAAGSAVFDAVSGVTNLTALTTAGIVEGAGTIALNGGASIFAAGARLAAAKILVNGGSAEVGGKLADTGDWAQSGATLVVDAGASINFKGAANSFSGALAGAGALTFSGGADTLTDTTLSAAEMTVNGAVLTISNVTLTGGGSLNLTNLTTNVVRGATAAATLTNAGDRITGAGSIGDDRMTLINGAGGMIIGNQTSALVIDTGANTVINAGVIENTGAGGTTIASRLENDGTLVAVGGTLTVNRAVSGAGTVKVAGGTAHFLAAFSQNAAFGASGVLELDHSRSYAGQVSGFSKTGATSLDLSDIAFGGATKASYSGTTASGVLTVTDGTHTSKITLLGNYTASTFTVADDGHGGTSVTDPAAALVGAMAAFGHVPPPHAATFAHYQSRLPATLARPA